MLFVKVYICLHCCSGLECESFVQFRTSKDGQHLVVTKMSTAHCHPINEVLKLVFLQHLPLRKLFTCLFIKFVIKQGL